MDKESIRKLPRDERIDVLRRQYIAPILRTWLSTHSSPDTPTLVMPSAGISYTPREIYVGVVVGDDIGKFLVKFLFDASKEYKTPVANFIQRAVDANQPELI